jgi:septum formation protein
VTFAPLTPAQIRRYVASGEPMGKAGAYAVQGAAAAHISHISGSYSGIMGLPMHETAALLRAFGFEI